jgi:hypothetical protein
MTLNPMTLNPMTLNPMTMEEALQGLKNGTLFEIIHTRCQQDALSQALSQEEALRQIERGESVLSPFSPPEMEALQELYGHQNVQEFIKREKLRLKKERKELEEALKETCTPLRSKRTAKLMMNLFG